MLEPLLELFILPTEAIHFISKSIFSLGLSTTLLGCKSLQCSFLTLLFPGFQMGRIQSFASEQLSQLSRSAALVGFSENFELVRG